MTVSVKGWLVQGLGIGVTLFKKCRFALLSFGEKYRKKIVIKGPSHKEAKKGNPKPNLEKETN